MAKAPRVTPGELADIRRRVLEQGGLLGRKPCPRPGCHSAVVQVGATCVCLTCGWKRAASEWELAARAFSPAEAAAGRGGEFRALVALIDPKRADKLLHGAGAPAPLPAPAPEAAAPPTAARQPVLRRIPELDDRAPPVLIYTDGGCGLNPGPGGWAAILWTPGEELELAGGAPRTTNNRMEMTAALEGLRALVKPSRVTVVTDSSYLFNGMTDWITKWSRDGWTRKGAPIPNHELWEQLARAALGHAAFWAWTRGHAGQPENERCDRLAAAMIAAVRDGREAPAHRARKERHEPLRRLAGTPTAPIWLAP